MGKLKEMCKNSISVRKSRLWNLTRTIRLIQHNCNFFFLFAKKAHKSTAGGKKTYLQSPSEPFGSLSLSPALL